MQLAFAERIKACGIHLAISIAIFAVALYLIVQVWYPAPYFNIAGGWQGVRIMIIVDLVLGPFLTLLVFDRSKGWSKLRFDLCCIAVAQFAALSWGFWAVYTQRPLAVVYWEGEFNIVVASDYDEQDAEPDALNRFGDDRPLLIVARPPRNSDEQAGMIAFQMLTGLMPWQLDFLHAPFAEHQQEVMNNAADARKHVRAFPHALPALEKLLREQNTTADDLRFYPVRARYGDAMLAFMSSGELVGALPGETFDGAFLGIPGL